MWHAAAAACREPWLAMLSGNANLAAIRQPSGTSSRLTTIPSKSLASRLPVSSGSK